MNSVITIHRGAFRMTLDVPKYVENVNLTTLKKVFNLLLDEPDRNTDAIETLDAYISDHVDEYQAKWSSASRAFVDNYVHPDFCLPDIRAKIIRQNAKWLNDVKNAKRQYVKYSKIQTAYREITKYFIR